MTASDHAQQRPQRFPLPERGRPRWETLGLTKRLPVNATRCSSPAPRVSSSQFRHAAVRPYLRRRWPPVADDAGCAHRADRGWRRKARAPRGPGPRRPCLGQAEGACRRRSPRIAVPLAVVAHTIRWHRVRVRAVACAYSAAGGVIYSLPSRSWIRPARRWRCTAIPTWFGRSLGHAL